MEEKVSLSDRFGLWLGFHACSQDHFLGMIRGYCDAYGIEIGDEELRAYTDASTPQYATMVDRIRQRLSLTTLKYQKLDDLVKAIGLPKTKLCTYCWDGCQGCEQHGGK